MLDCLELYDYTHPTEDSAFRTMQNDYRRRTARSLRKGKLAPAADGPCIDDGDHRHIHEQGSGAYVGAITSCPCEDEGRAVTRYRIIWTR